MAQLGNGAGIKPMIYRVEAHERQGKQLFTEDEVDSRPVGTPRAI